MPKRTRSTSTSSTKPAPRSTRSKRGRKLPARVPKSVLEQAVQAGAVREDCPGEDLCILRMTYQDDAWKVFEEWINQLDADPGVHAIFAPSAKIVNTAITPPNGLAIQNEANSIINHYAPLTEADFPSPVIPGPIAAPIMPINIHHANIALNAVFERIQNIQDANYPILANLPSGSYICNVLIQWANVAHTTTIFKP